MDCFAEPVIGARIRATRSLAMTGLMTPIHLKAIAL
jgi:hypothetical protein